VGPIFTKSAYAYEELRRRILSGEMGPGSTIAQQQVAEEMGVSTTPVREALRRLDAEGLVSISAHRDALVATLSHDEFASMNEVRQNLDPLGARLGAARRTDSEARLVESTLAVLETFETNSGSDYMIAHRNFHRAVYEASHNDLLISTLEGLWDKAERYRQARVNSTPLTTAHLHRIRTEHTEIAAAVVAGDPERAERAMKVHMAVPLDDDE
jgi:DNA-binding GntR family transcriptional regulator